MSNTQVALPSVWLYYAEGSSNKVYHARVEEQDGGYMVHFGYGRRGTTLNTGTKTPAPIPYHKAVAVYEKLVGEKRAKGYTEDSAGTPYTSSEYQGTPTGMLPQLLNDVDQATANALLKDFDWCIQEKHDGRRILVSVAEQESGPAVVTGANRRGLMVALPQSVADELMDYPTGEYDGEMVGSTFYIFDILSYEGDDQRNRPYSDRLRLLTTFFDGAAIRIVRTARTFQEKEELIKAVRAAKGEGIVFKRLDAPYMPGRPNSGGSQLKYKFWQSATLKVGKVHATKRSVSLVELGGREVGNVTIPTSCEIPSAGELAEIKYLYCYPKGSLYQPQYQGVRDDKTEPDAEKTFKFKAQSGEEDSDDN